MVMELTVISSTLWLHFSFVTDFDYFMASLFMSFLLRQQEKSGPPGRQESTRFLT